MIVIVTAAAAFTAPAPIDASSWFRGFSNNPKPGPPTLIMSEITVNPSGHVETCLARTIVGDASWAPFTCGRILRGGWFRPARVAGRSKYGIYRLRTAWIQRGAAPADWPTWDMEVPVSPVPPGLKLPLLQKIKFHVDVSGQVRACDVSGKWDHPELAATACAQLTRKMAIAPAKTRRGNPVESVQDASVRYVAGTGTPPR